MITMIALDAYLVDLARLDSWTIAKYLGMIGILILNTVYLLQYKIKGKIEDHLNKGTETLKIKWLSFLFMSFLSPMFVFFFN
jgi:hypothetical protein